MPTRRRRPTPVFTALAAWAALVAWPSPEAMASPQHAAPPVAVEANATSMAATGRPVAPGWYALTPPPEGVDGWPALDNRDGFVVQGTWGRVNHTDGSRWVVTELPEAVIDQRRRVVFRDALVVSPTEAYVYGTRQTIYRWDGHRWRLEHQDRRTGERSHFVIEQCNGRIEATDRWSTKIRQADGTWTSLGRVDRGCATADSVPSPAQCWRHSHWKAARVVWCRAGLHIWDAAAEAWRVHPASKAEVGLTADGMVGWESPVRRWQSGSTLLVAVGPRVYEWSDRGWTPVFESPGPDVLTIVGTAQPQIIADGMIWTR